MAPWNPGRRPEKLRIESTGGEFVLAATRNSTCSKPWSKRHDPNAMIQPPRPRHMLVVDVVPGKSNNQKATRCSFAGVPADDPRSLAPSLKILSLRTRFNPWRWCRAILRSLQWYRWKAFNRVLQLQDASGNPILHHDVSKVSATRATTDCGVKVVWAHVPITFTITLWGMNEPDLTTTWPCVHDFHLEKVTVGEHHFRVRGFEHCVVDDAPAQLSAS